MWHSSFHTEFISHFICNFFYHRKDSCLVYMNHALCARNAFSCYFKQYFNRNAALQMDVRIDYHNKWEQSKGEKYVYWCDNFLHYYAIGDDVLFKGMTSRSTPIFLLLSENSIKFPSYSRLSLGTQANTRQWLSFSSNIVQAVRSHWNRIREVAPKMYSN